MNKLARTLIQIVRTESNRIVDCIAVVVHICTNYLFMFIGLGYELLGEKSKKKSFLKVRKYGPYEKL